MKFENLLELINAVSKSSLTDFVYEENEVKVRLSKKDRKTIVKEESTMAVQEVIPEARETSAGGNVITSPLVGTFYAAPAEDAPAFVSLGDTIKKGQVLGIVEAMKLMNEIESEYEGVIEEILIENGESVEYGQPLFRLK